MWRRVVALACLGATVEAQCLGDTSRVGDGYCDDATLGPDDPASDLYNNEACDWDGGDCCKCSCSGGSCGGSSKADFGKCRDPEYDGKNGADHVCAASSSGPDFSFVQERLVGISWYPSAVVLSWQAATDPNYTGEGKEAFSLSLKDLTNGGGWVNHDIMVDARDDDDWYVWTGIGNSEKGFPTASYPFECSTSYLARIVKGTAKSGKLSVTTPYCAGDCTDDEAWSIKAGRDCKWVESKINAGNNLDRICGKTDSNALSAFVACPVACQQCGPTYGAYSP
jgi:hypothetical protein